jgi:hypothetical protein
MGRQYEGGGVMRVPLSKNAKVLGLFLVIPLICVLTFFFSTRTYQHAVQVRAEQVQELIKDGDAAWEREDYATDATPTSRRMLAYLCLANSLSRM